MSFPFTLPPIRSPCSADRTSRRIEGSTAGHFTRAWHRLLGTADYNNDGRVDLATYRSKARDQDLNNGFEEVCVHYGPFPRGQHVQFGDIYNYTLETYDRSKASCVRFNSFVGINHLQLGLLSDKAWERDLNEAAQAEQVHLGPSSQPPGIVINFRSCRACDQFRFDTGIALLSLGGDRSGIASPFVVDAPKSLAAGAGALEGVPAWLKVLLVHEEPSLDERDWKSGSSHGIREVRTGFDLDHNGASDLAFTLDGRQYVAFNAFSGAHDGRKVSSSQLPPDCMLIGELRTGPLSSWFSPILQPSHDFNRDGRADLVVSYEARPFPVNPVIKWPDRTYTSTGATSQGSNHADITVSRGIRASNAFDGNKGAHNSAVPAWPDPTYFSGTYTGGTNINGYLGDWIKIDLRQSVVLSYYKIYPDPAVYTRAIAHPRDFALFGSDDNWNRYELDRRTGIDWSDFQPQEFQISGRRAYRWYFLIINSIGHSGQYVTPELCELEFYGEASATYAGRLGDPAPEHDSGIFVLTGPYEASRTSLGTPLARGYDRNFYAFNEGKGFHLFQIPSMLSSPSGVNYLSWGDFNQDRASDLLALVVNPHDAASESFPPLVRPMLILGCGGYIPACQNGIVDPGEQCDDGNSFDMDGCSPQCEYEDPSGTGNGAVWACTDDAGGRTSCCRSLLNPVTQAYVCTCAGQASPSAGYTVRADCSLRDVDECASRIATCHEDAVCQNLDATVFQNDTYRCFCPPGMNGDGVQRCDIFVFITKFDLQLDSLPEGGSTDLEGIIRSLFDNKVFPASVQLGDIEVRFVQASRRRRRSLLQESGAELEVSVTSGSEEEMDSLTTEIDTDAALASVCNATNQTGECGVVSQPPRSVVVTVDQAFGTVQTILSGFAIPFIGFDSDTGVWTVRARYVPDTPNTISSLYMSKPGKPPYNNQVKDSFFVSMHPCMRSSSICCLNDYKDLYEVGPFHDNITRSIGTCGQEIRERDTLGLFSAEENRQIVDQFFAKYPLSSVRRVSDTDVELLISTLDIRDSFSVVEQIGTGYTMHFAVGMSYYTLLPAPAVSTVAAQVNAFFVVTDTITVSFASQQEYTFLKYITVSILQVLAPSPSFCRPAPPCH